MMLEYKDNLLEIREKRARSVLIGRVDNDKIKN